MPILELGPGRIAFEVTGSGPVLLMTHGFMATSMMWRRQVQELSSEWTVVTWDLPGHGRTRVPIEGGAYKQGLVARCIAALLDHVGAAKAVLFGLSLGGYASLEFCLRQPERVAGLVLCSTGPGFRKTAAREAWNDRLDAVAADLDERGLSVLQGSRMGREVADAVHDSAAGIAATARGYARQHDSTVIDGLETITCPVLLVAGDRDSRFVRASEYMHTRFPDSELAIIPSAGHAVNLDDPVAFTERVAVFLRQRFGAAPHCPPAP